MPVSLNEQRTKVFLDRYALKDERGKPVEHTVEEMWLRVAAGISDTLEEYENFYDILEDFKFVPGGRILAGAGTGTEVTFYNCYVIPVETKARRFNRTLRTAEGGKFAYTDDQPDPGNDSREAILDTTSVMVDIMSRGGGVGINWSVLRPKGTHLSRVNGTTSGPVSWMDVASHAVQTVTQGGSRRGAAMFMLDDWHPDVMEFIDAKRNLDKITGANVSVAVSDDFMRAVDDDDEWTFEFPDTTDSRYNSEWDGDLAGWKARGGGVVSYATRPAREVWRAIAEAAWDNGEPGVVFLDRYNALSTGAGRERIICVNPCGEQGLGAYSVCNLGSMNLDAYITKSSHYKKVTGYEFDWENFQKDVMTAITFLDNVIDKNFYFLPENEAIQKDLRRVGLGVMGLADALIALGYRYGSDEAVEFTDRLFSTMKTAAIRRSCLLAQQKGTAPAWDREMTSRPYLRQYAGTPLGGQVRKYGLRNIFLLTQAPTGSTSLLAGVNSGIEPYFAFKYLRKDRTGEHVMLASAIEKYSVEGTVRGPEWVTSNDVTVEEHIAMQAAVQRHVDSSVSKTINAPNDHTVEDVEKAYMLAYQSGLKGLAYFRDGNGRDQVLYKDAPAPTEVQNDIISDLRDEVERLVSLVPVSIEYERPDYLVGTTHKVLTRAGSAYVTVNRDPESGRAVEVFFNVGKAGSEVASMAEALGRLGSLALRKGATLGGVANQLDGVGGRTKFNKAIPHAISEALSRENVERPVLSERQEEVVPEREQPDAPQVQNSTSGRLDVCPECQNLSLSYQEGCSKCAVCGFSAC